MSTPIIQNLIPSLRETVFKHLQSYLGGEGELSSIQESLEFWWDRTRDKEHPDLPMWQDVPTADRDQLFDAWHDAMEEFWRERLTKSDPVTSPLPVSVAPAASLSPEVVKEALEGLIRYVESQGCSHEDTHRGGSIWTICSTCGMKWADDEGGMPSHFPEPKPVQIARDTLSKLNSALA